MLLLVRFGKTKWKAAILLVPVVAVFTMPRIGRVRNYEIIDKRPILEVADWAEKSTWGSSMFLFPDAGRALYPGIFRARSRRALWVDWNSGSLVAYFEPFAVEWWQRWQQTVEGTFSLRRLQNLLPLPIDYYVLKRSNQLADIRPVFINREFVVYDSQDLKNASAPLRPATQR